MRICTRAFAALIVSVGALVTGVAAAPAATPIATHSTPGCPSAPHWRIAYRMYFADTAGRTTSRDAVAAAEAEIAKFADAVGKDSACGVGVDVDVYDEGTSQWPTSPNSDTLPSDTSSFIAAGNYDWVFYRFPANGEPFCANTNGGYAPSASRFPVDADGRLGCSGGPTSGDCLCEPWALLMEHEWLHAVVAFYEPRLGWPTPDVHGACVHGYGANCNIDAAYFADMMQGKVMESGSHRGITPDEWAAQGTPALPRRRPFGWTLRTGAGLDAVAQLPADFDGTATLQVLDTQAAVVMTVPAHAGDTPFRFPSAGRWAVCLTTTGATSYRAGRGCAGVSVSATGAPGTRTPVGGQGSPSPPPGTATPQILKRLVVAKALRIVRRRHRKLVVTYNPKDESNPGVKRSFTLVASHDREKREIRGRRSGGRVAFTVTLSPGLWRLKVRVTAGTRTASSATVAVRVR